MGDKVHVTLAVDQGTKIPSSAFASLVAPQVLGSPDVDLNPGYTGGPYLPSGATIAQDHTAVPVSTDEVLKELQHTLDALNPHAVGNLVSNLASDLERPGGQPQQAHRVGRRHRAAAGRQGQRPRTAERHAGPADRHARRGHGPDRAPHRAVRHGVDHRGPALGPAQRRHHPAGGRQLEPGQPAGAQHPAARGGRRDGDHGRAHPGPQPRLGRRDPPERQQPLPGGQARLRPHLQLAEPEPPDGTRRDRRLHRRPAARPAGGHLPAHRRPTTPRASRRPSSPRSPSAATPRRASSTRCSTTSRPSSTRWPAGAGRPRRRRCSRRASTRSRTPSRAPAPGPPRHRPPPAQQGPAAAPTTTTTTAPPPSTTTTTVPCGLLGALLGCPKGSSGSRLQRLEHLQGLGLLVGRAGRAALQPGHPAAGSPARATTTLAVAAPATTTPNPDPTLTAPAAALLPPLPQDRHPGQAHRPQAHRGLLSGWLHDIGSWF